MVGGKCISSAPVFWNVFLLGDSGLRLYYGFDSKVLNSIKYVYFRIVGTTKSTRGYVGLGIGNSMFDADIIMLRYVGLDVVL